MIRSDNAVQFSKTIALLGAAGKISTTRDRRQPPKRPFGNLFLPFPTNRKTPVLHKKTAASFRTGGFESGGYAIRLSARSHPFTRAVEEIVFHRGGSSLAPSRYPVKGQKSGTSRTVVRGPIPARSTGLACTPGVPRAKTLQKACWPRSGQWFRRRSR